MNTEKQRKTNGKNNDLPRRLLFYWILLLLYFSNLSLSNV